MVKQWKVNPPGEEQITLEAMFEEGGIADYETAATVQARNELFKPFSDRVFASHFNKTRAKFGYGIAAKPTVGNGIPELGGQGQESKAFINSGSDSRKRASSSVEVGDLHFKNAPYIVWVYADHDKRCEIVCVAIPIISGARNVDFFLSDDNITLNVTYAWPSALCSPEQLFKKKLSQDGGGWTLDHPKIHAFNTRLLELELTKSSKPPASIVIKLPMKVQRESHTYTYAGVKTDDGNILMLEFQAFQKLHVIADTKTEIIFE